MFLNHPISSFSVNFIFLSFLRTPFL